MAWSVSSSAITVVPRRYHSRISEVRTDLRIQVAITSPNYPWIVAAGPSSDLPRAPRAIDQLIDMRYAARRQVCYVSAANNIRAPILSIDTVLG